jgi:hypothetical protein
MTELSTERQAVAAGVRAVGSRPVMFEEFGGRDADPEQAYLAEVEGADIYIGILGRRYGKPLKSRYSPTHGEFRHAEKHALRMAVWTLATDEREGPQQSFLDEVRTFYVPASPSPERSICSTAINTAIWFARRTTTRRSACAPSPHRISMAGH